MASSSLAEEATARRRREEEEEELRALRGAAEYNAKAFDAMAVTIDYLANKVLKLIPNL